MTELVALKELLDKRERFMRTKGAIFTERYPPVTLFMSQEKEMTNHKSPSIIKVKEINPPMMLITSQVGESIIKGKPTPIIRVKVFPSQHGGVSPGIALGNYSRRAYLGRQNHSLKKVSTPKVFPF